MTNKKDSERKENEYRPWGEDGPVVRILPPSETPKPGSELTTAGFRILRALPREVGQTRGVHAIAEHLKCLGDYSGYMNMINSLIKHGYIKMDKGGWVSLTQKGREELH